MKWKLLIRKESRVCFFVAFLFSFDVVKTERPHLCSGRLVNTFLETERERKRRERAAVWLACFTKLSLRESSGTPDADEHRHRDYIRNGSTL